MKYFTFLVILLSSCVNNIKKNEVIKSESKPLTYTEILRAHIDSIKSDKDTTFLGFILESSKKDVMKHLNKLILEGKTSKSETITFRAAGIGFKLSGNPYTIYLEDKSTIKVLFELRYLKGNLFAIDLQIYEKFDLENVKNLLNKKYGAFSNMTSTNNTMTYTWLVNNTEIEATGNPMGGDIQYFDLKKKHKFEKEIKEVKKQVNQIKQIETKKDL